MAVFDLICDGERWETEVDKYIADIHVGVSNLKFCSIACPWIHKKHPGHLVYFCVVLASTDRGHRQKTHPSRVMCSVGKYVFRADSRDEEARRLRRLSIIKATIREQATELGKTRSSPFDLHENPTKDIRVPGSSCTFSAGILTNGCAIRWFRVNRTLVARPAKDLRQLSQPRRPLCEQVSG